VPGHESRYQPVDDFEEKFEEFKKVFDSPGKLHSRGHLFVVAGDRGYGKTSLRQRCAFWIYREYNQQNCEIAVVDLSDESWDPDTVDQQLLRVRRWILRSLDDGRVDHSDITRIEANNDIAESFYDLGVKLRMRGIAQGNPMPLVLLVLLPGYPSPEELKRYYGLAREGIIFMAEILHPDAIRDITEKIKARQDGFNRNNIDAHILPLGTLKAGDDDLLMTWMQANLHNCPGLTNGEVRGIIRELIQEKSVSISHLVKLLIGALRFAIKEHAGEVTVNHVARYYRDQFFSS
jgi:hypothetical protein